MSAYSKGRAEITSPERTKIWVEPKLKSEQKVPVVYYLARNGQLDHPHFMEVTLSSPQGLFLRDVTKRLNFLRGQGMANMYFWSSKRSYKNGYVWQDLSENDFIYPCHGNEYILKGSQLLDKSISFRSYETALSSANTNSSETSSSSSEDSNFPAIVRRKNRSWSSLNELNGHEIYKAMIGINASTQTNDHKRERIINIEEVGYNRDGIADLSREQISPPQSRLCEQSIESLKDCIEADASADVPHQSSGRDIPSGRMKAAPILMQLIACGSRRIKDF